MALLKALKEFMEMPPYGHVPEWLWSGLQNRLPRFNSGRGLHLQNQWLRGLGSPLEIRSERQAWSDGWGAADVAGVSWLARSWLARSWLAHPWLAHPWLVHESRTGSHRPTGRTFAHAQRRPGFSVMAAFPALVTFQLRSAGSSAFSGSISFFL